MFHVHVHQEYINGKECEFTELPTLFSYKTVTIVDILFLKLICTLDVTTAPLNAGYTLQRKPVKDDPAYQFLLQNGTIWVLNEASRLSIEWSVSQLETVSLDCL